MELTPELFVCPCLPPKRGITPDMRDAMFGVNEMSELINPLNELCEAYRAKPGAPNLATMKGLEVVVCYTTIRHKPSC